MIDKGPAQECEVVIAFLKPEIDSRRWSWMIALGFGNLRREDITIRELIMEPDLKNEEHNKFRTQVLDFYRGYLRRNIGIFKDFPNDATWRRTELEAVDLDRLRYCRDDCWVQLTRNTRKPSALLKRFANGECAELASQIDVIKKRLQKGERPPELVIAEMPSGELVLLEGHHRATAFVALNWQENVPAFVASSPNMKNWYFGYPADQTP